MEVSYKTIGSNIRRARKALNLTQAHVAEKLGLSLLHYGRLERGNRNVSFHHLLSVAQTLSVSFHDLLNGAIIDEHGISQQIADTFCDIPQEDVQLIRELYQLLKNRRI